MPGLVSGIHVLFCALRGNNVDGRDKPGHDEGSANLYEPRFNSASATSG